jgi:dihydroneopterin aldolase
MAVDKITLTGLKVYGYHGVLNKERKKGQEFIVDISVSYKSNKAVDTDDIEYAINYSEIALIAKQVIEGEPKNLIEKVADDIATKIIEKFDVKTVRVTLHKPNAPLDVIFDDVSVSVERMK